MVVTIKRRGIRRGGVSPPERYNDHKLTNFAVNLCVSRAGGETPPLRTASLIHPSTPTTSYLSVWLNYGRFRPIKDYNKTMPDIQKSLPSFLQKAEPSFFQKAVPSFFQFLKIMLLANYGRLHKIKLLLITTLDIQKLLPSFLQKAAEVVELTKKANCFQKNCDNTWQIMKIVILCKIENIHTEFTGSSVIFRYRYSPKYIIRRWCHG